MTLPRVSTALGVAGSLFAFGVAATLVALRASASDRFFPHYLEASLIGFALGVLQVGVFGSLQLFAALRRSDAIRASVLWGVSSTLLIEGLSHAGAMDIVGVWLVPAGMFGAISALVATLEAQRKALVLVLGPVLMLLSYATVWLLARAASVV